MENYLKTICNGHEHVLQALPKLLSIWFRLAALPSVASSSSASSSSSAVSVIPAPPKSNSLVKVLDYLGTKISQAMPGSQHRESIPACTWYLAMPQLVSRISHPHENTSRLIRDIVIKVVTAHPHQVV